MLHKVDDYSGVALQGAEFTIWQYDPKTQTWQPWSGGVNGVITTDEKGQVSLTVLENGGPQTLKPDVLYKIVETKAPQNYQKDDTPHYVLFHKSSETPQTAFDTATGKGRRWMEKKSSSLKMSRWAVLPRPPRPSIPTATAT